MNRIKRQMQVKVKRDSDPRDSDPAILGTRFENSVYGGITPTYLRM